MEREGAQQGTNRARNHQGRKIEMKPGSNRAVLFALGTTAVFLLSFAVRVGRAAPPQGSAAPAPSKGEMSQDYFKDIQVLRNIPVDQFMGTMGFIAASTGMNCTDCHGSASSGSWKLYSTDTPMKQTARKMMLMMRTINQGFFGGVRRVDCYSCHRGSRIPEVLPDLAIQYEVPPPYDPDVVTQAAPDAPPVDQILDKFIQALGGEQRLAAIKSFVGTGTYRDYDDPTFYPTELYAKAPNQRTLVMHEPGGSNTVTCDGVSAWSAAPADDFPKPVLTLTNQNLDGAKFDAELSFPWQIKQSLHNWIVGPMTSIGDEDVRIVQGTGANGAIIKLYFDPKTGLLVRQLREVNTEIGAIPTQVDYSDYQDVDGVKMPFHWVVTWTDGRNVYDMKQVRLNVPVEESRFAKPGPSMPPSK
jgi:Photosynthetic reaction centre cytochrome C subunit